LYTNVLLSYILKEKFIYQIVSLKTISGGGTINKIIDIVKVKGNSYIHKQIETRDGMLFMRLKRRQLPIHA